MRVEDRQWPTRVTVAGGAHVLAHGLTDDLAARIENASDNCSVNIGHEALQECGARRHRNPGEADAVLENDTLARQWTPGPSLDAKLSGPGIIFVFRSFRLITGRSRIFHGR